MRVPAVLLTTLLVCLVFVAPAMAQEGHPLKGSWLGTWGSADDPDVVVVILDWDGKEITGIINPGTENIAIENAMLNPDGWVVHFEARRPGQGGQTLNYVLEGTIENLPFNDRFIRGTWRNQNGTGPFEITRQ